MNAMPELLALLFGAVTLALLAWPFYPAWREWRHPSDDRPLALHHEAPALHAAVNPGTPAPAPKRGQRQLLTHLPNAQPWGDQGWRVQGDCTLPKDSCLPGPLVVTGQLRCGARSLIEGDVKVYGPVKLAPGSTLGGALFAHSVMLADGAQVLGPVVVAATAQLGPHATVGREEHPASLSAQRLLTHDSACIHGPIWTRAQGGVS
jgi:hypothetical protein